MTTLHEYFVYDGDDPQVELGDALVSIDDFLLDNFAVRFFGKLAAVEAGRAKEALHHGDGRWILSCEVYGRRQHCLFHAGQLKEHPAAEKRPDLHEMIFFRVEVYLVGSFDGGHLVRAHLIQTENVNPHVLLKDSAFAVENKFRDGTPLGLPLIGHDSVWSGGKVRPLHLYEAVPGNHRVDIALFLPIGLEKVLAGHSAFQQMT